MPKLIEQNKRKPRTWTLKDYYLNRNKVLIVRETGGLGDILMHRMLFEDIKNETDACIHFACPSKYHPAVTDHPFIDKVLSSDTVNPQDYICYHNTTSACCRWETSHAPLGGKHRSDIWAEHCGITLKNHNMHINLDAEYKEHGKNVLKSINKDGKPSVVFCPISAMIVKNLTDEQMQGTILGLKKMGLFVYGLHTRPIDAFEKVDSPVICGQSIKQWMGMIEAADYVISVDSAAFHYAGGIGKPTVGIFTFADGKTYGKFYNFELVQMHRDNGNWDCGPCYNWPSCPKTQCVPKPCLTMLTASMILKGVENMLNNRSI